MGRVEAEVLKQAWAGLDKDERRRLRRLGASEETIADPRDRRLLVPFFGAVLASRTRLRESRLVRVLWLAAMLGIVVWSAMDGSWGNVVFCLVMTAWAVYAVRWRDRVRRTAERNGIGHDPFADGLEELLR